jgi:hypothetical protein
MSAIRLISLPLHGALEFAVGVLTMAAPFMLGFGPGATVAAVVIGALVVGLALAATVAEVNPLPLAAHWAFDRGLAIGMLLAATGLAIADDRVAALYFALVGLFQLALALVTRYSAAH